MKLKTFFNKLLPMLLFTLITALMINYNGCGDSAVTPTTPDENFDTQTSAAKYSSESEKTAAYVSTCIFQVLNGITTFPGSCPAITVDTTFRTITVNYGSNPCLALTDDIRRSGSYTISYYISPLRDSAAGNVIFNDYRIYRVSGSSTDTNYVTLSGSTLTGAKKIDAEHFNCVFVMNNTFTAAGNSSRNVNLTLNANANLGLIGSFSDDVFTIYGSGTVTDKSANTYAYSIAQNDTIKVLINCRYPVTGRATLTRSSDTYIINFHPSSGSCDGIIEVTKGSLTKTFNLDGFEF